MTLPMTLLTTSSPAISTVVSRVADHDTHTTPAADVLAAGTKLMLKVNAFARATPWLHGLMYNYATYGVALFAVLLVAGWWSARRSGNPARVAAAVWAGLGTIVAVGINQPIVTTVHEARPYTTMPGLLVLADRSSDLSFPSDHATMAGAVAAGLFLARRRLLAWVATVAAVLIAFARVYIAAHYPQDVTAGLILGTVVVLAGWILLHTPLTALVGRIQDTPLQPLVTSTPRTPAPAKSASLAGGDTTRLPRASSTPGAHQASGQPPEDRHAVGHRENPPW